MKKVLNLSVKVLFTTLILLGTGLLEAAAVDNAVPRLLDLATTDIAALLTAAIANYDKTITDYTGTFYKQECVRGKLQPEKIVSFKFTQEPFSVFMKWEKNPGPADKLLYIEGANDNKMLIHPTGLMSWIKSVKRKPDCKSALKLNLYPCTKFGLRNMMSKVLPLYQLASKQGQLQTRLLDATEIDGRNQITIETIFPTVVGYKTRRLQMQIDLEYGMPVAIVSFDKNEKLIGRYAFTNLQFNTGLNPAQFTARANGM